MIRLDLLLTTQRVLERDRELERRLELARYLAEGRGNRPGWWRIVADLAVRRFRLSRHPDPAGLEQGTREAALSERFGPRMVAPANTPVSNAIRSPSTVRR